LGAGLSKDTDWGGLKMKARASILGKRMYCGMGRCVKIVFTMSRAGSGHIMAAKAWDRRYIAFV